MLEKTLKMKPDERYENIKEIRKILVAVKKRLYPDRKNSVKSIPAQTTGGVPSGISQEWDIVNVVYVVIRIILVLFLGI